MSERVQRTLIRTYLSQKPQADAAWVAFGVFCLFFLCTYLFWSADSAVSGLLVARPSSVFGESRYWQLISSTFLHGDLKHFLSNFVMGSLLLFLIYGYFGFKQILLLIFLIGSLVNYLTLLSHPPHVGLLGFSGVVYAMAGYWLALYLLIDRRRTWIKRVLRGLGFSLMVLIPTTFEPDVSHTAHGWGYLLGGVHGTLYFVLHKGFFRSFEEERVEVASEDPYFFQ